MDFDRYLQQSGGSPVDVASKVATEGGLTAGSYILVLLAIFFTPPLVIALSRRYHWNEKIHLEGWIRKVAAMEKVKNLMLQNRELSKRPLNQQVK